MPTGRFTRQLAAQVAAQVAEFGKPLTVHAMSTSWRYPQKALSVTPPIEDYALVGDCQGSALVSTDGSVDWMCLPRFDSPACFARLVGTARNGFWKIGPGQAYRVRRQYLQDTLVLETTFTTPSGVVRLLDWMPVRAGHPRMFRRVYGVSGVVEMTSLLFPSFGYGSVQPRIFGQDGAITFQAGPDALTVWSPATFAVMPDGVTSTFTVCAGDQMTFELAWSPAHEASPAPALDDESLSSAVAYWRQWSAQCTYRGPARSAVLRSLITLKALTYTPTGGMVAAPTTSLPERLGGSRNWDYRYCWVRDSALALGAFMRCGYDSETESWWQWLLRASAGNPGRLNVLYGVAGERDLPERTLRWLPGYENSRPVRIGNAAASQAQLDLYGELIRAFSLYRERARQLGRLVPNGPTWDQEVAIIEYVRSMWKKPDRGIWEVRDRSRHFTFSKAMAWAAVDRAIYDAECYGYHAPLNEWKTLRAHMHASICKQGVDRDTGSFNMAYDLPAMDGSLLLLSDIGFLPPNDPRIVATIERAVHDLDDHGLVRRYMPGAPGPKDGRFGNEGVFLPVSFWLVSALSHVGRWQEAATRLARLLELRNDVGLFSEEYDTEHCRQVGNFPQAFTHVALVDSALALEDALERQPPHRPLGRKRVSNSLP